ncbi:NAD-dependent deacetylase hst4 [Nosema bombycis CQ1]|uniref:NAD-dependent deacetylase hst4 n=1 Tax=Nosema bombycis (strain CQ1 / CVCC 102059) TaxID=578461 RepID=R0KX27_NOSB1|nr:NAD-dependent deacetylase hst4 [Nosema bombycis CQ1]|eukprot:EOB14777.1 NAD-dependent deacetylase hst4 [Nosema bombycis CQ1]
MPTLIDSEWIKKNIKKFYKKKVVIITGAGISVASGIPDFRSKSGIFAEIKEKFKVNGSDLFTYKFGINKETRRIYLKYICKLKKLVEECKPSYTHLFFKYFVERSKKLRVYTQNIDGLEIKGGLKYQEDSKTELVHLHGDLKFLKCINCGIKEEFKEELINKIEKGLEIQCKSCKSKRKTTPTYLHTNIIHYYQDHPYSELISNCIQNDTGCNLLIVVGTRLDVFGVENMVKYFTNKKITSIFINPEHPKKKIENYFEFYYPGKSDEFFEILKEEIEKYRIYRKVKRLSLCKEEGKDIGFKKSKEDPLKQKKKDNINSLKKLSLTTRDIESSFLTIENDLYSPCPKKYQKNEEGS